MNIKQLNDRVIKLLEELKITSEALNEGKKREVLSDEEYAKFLLSYMYNDPTYEELLNMLPMINDDLYLEEIKTIKRPKLKSLYKKAVELKKQTNESIKEEFKNGEMLKNIEDIKNIYWDPRLDYDQVRQKIEEYASEHNLTGGDIQWILGPDSYHNLYMEDDEYDEYDDFDESLKGYKEVAKIIKNEKGYNVAEKDEPMLVEDKSSLKSLLTELAKYL